LQWLAAEKINLINTSLIRTHCVRIANAFEKPQQKQQNGSTPVQRPLAIATMDGAPPRIIDDPHANQGNGGGATLANAKELA
jgi:hypothetical protein